MPISTASAPAAGDGPHDVGPVVAQAAGDVRDEQLAACVARRAQGRLERRPLRRSPEQVHHLRDVLVAPTRQVHEHRRALQLVRAARSDPRDGVRRFERRDDALGARENWNASMTSASVTGS